MNNFQAGFFSKLAEAGLTSKQALGMYKYAQDAAAASAPSWQDTAKDYLNSYGGYGLGGALAGGLLGALFTKKDRLRGALLGALAGGAGGAGLYGHNKVVDEANSTLAASNAAHAEELAKQQAGYKQQLGAAEAARKADAETAAKAQANLQARMDAQAKAHEQALADNNAAHADQLAALRGDYEQQLREMGTSHQDEVTKLLEELSAQSDLANRQQAMIDRGVLTSNDLQALTAILSGYNGYPTQMDALPDETLQRVKTLMGVTAAGSDTTDTGEKFDPSGLMSYIDTVLGNREAVRSGNALIQGLSTPVRPATDPAEIQAQIQAMQENIRVLQEQQRRQAAEAAAAERRRRVALEEAKQRQATLTTPTGR